MEETIMTQLQFGSKGKEVEKLQTILNNKGYSCFVDGDFGTKTKASVIAFQRDAGIKQDGIVGPITWTKLTESKLTAVTEKKEEVKPEPVKEQKAEVKNTAIESKVLNNVHVIECTEVVLAEVKGKQALKDYTNSICGTFTYPSGTNACSILVNGGKTICSYSCHYWPATGMKPETVLYRLKDGTFGVKRCKTASELPTDVVWAVGGMGLLDMYDPIAEGFTGKFADVRRKTDHNVIAVMPNGKIILAILENMDDVAVNKWVKSINAKYAVLLDGGHLGAMNSEKFKKKTTTKMGVIIQAVK
jgi:hypothetical protein